jgi:transposase
MTSMGQEKMSNLLSLAVALVTIGIDISKLYLDVHVHPDGCIRRFTNDRAGYAALIAWITPKHPTRIIFEATGAYHRALQNALAAAGLPGVKINPWQARRFAEATGRRVKTDPIDAAMLARFGATLQPDIPPARDPAIDALAELQAARRALVKDRTATLNRPVRLRGTENRHKTIQKSRAEVGFLGSLKSPATMVFGGGACGTEQKRTPA